jgi:predicted CXXCH cytochrome family protein
VTPAPAVRHTLLLALALATGAAGGSSPPAPAPDTPAFLAARGVRVTAGAAPGYVEDRVCADCHPDVAKSFAAVGMARSFLRPSRERSIESFGTPFEHAPSRRVYEMSWRGERLVFRRWQLGLHGERSNELEQEVDWVLGSGNHARTYLFRTPSGELWQLPVAWYTREGRWGMAPGYDRPDHEEVSRQVQRECMVCHDAYPELPAGADAYGVPHRFPATMPEGVGCQRCHGPGAEHVRQVRDPDVPMAKAKAAIVNPAKLPTERRTEVCYQCHLQPAVALPAVRRFERGDLAFRPGEALAAHRVELDPGEEGRSREERFEINHHPYRLEQSRCFRESRGALSCLSCHDPHRKVSPAERAAHYAAVCLGCHRDTLPAGHAGEGPRDCTNCHMPERRTEDVVHAVMTDHRIQRPAAGIDLLAPREERDPVLVAADFFRPAEAPPGTLGEVYRATGVLRIGGRSALDRLERLLAAEPPPQAEPWLRLAVGELQARRYAETEAALRRAFALAGGDTPLARVWLGLSLAGQRRLPEALAELAAAAARDPELVEAPFDRGRLLLAKGRAAEALPDLLRAVALRPNLAAGWLRLGEAKEALGRRADALADFRRALAVEPSTTDAYLALARALRAEGDADAAAEVLALGARYARRPEALAEAERTTDGGGP